MANNTLKVVANMTKAKNRELKNCPFCGGVAEVATYYEHGKARGKFVFCTKCSITQEHPYSSKQNAINVWNRRFVNKTTLVIDDNNVEEIGELIINSQQFKKAIDDIIERASQDTAESICEYLSEFNNKGIDMIIKKIKESYCIKGE